MTSVPLACEIALLLPAPAGPDEYWLAAPFEGACASKVRGVVLAAGVDWLDALCGVGLTVWRRGDVLGCSQLRNVHVGGHIVTGPLNPQQPC